MKIFLSYSSKDVSLAEKIYFSLVGQDHEVFFDRSALPKGGDYNKNIIEKINNSDLLIFLISKHSVEKKSYALTEMKCFQEKNPKAENKLLPVLIEDVDFEKIPNYLSSVTILDVEGNVTAEVLNEVNKLSRNKYLIPSIVRNNYFSIFFLTTVIIFGSVLIQLYDEGCPDPSIHQAFKDLDDNMVKVEAGRYVMGINDGNSNTQAKVVEFESFWGDKYKVTNAQYKKFLVKTNYKTKGGWRDDWFNNKEFHPVTNVTWDDAKAYCKSVNKRLPSLKEWEYLCRGKNNFIYPWGDKFKKKLANVNNYCGNSTIGVGSFAKRGADNDTGVSGVFGNAREWIDASLEVSNKLYRVAKGQSFQKSEVIGDCLTEALLEDSDYDEGISFRCVKSEVEQ